MPSFSRHTSLTQPPLVRFRHTQTFSIFIGTTDRMSVQKRWQFLLEELIVISWPVPKDLLVMITSDITNLSDICIEQRTSQTVTAVPNPARGLGRASRSSKSFNDSRTPRFDRNFVRRAPSWSAIIPSEFVLKLSSEFALILPSTNHSTSSSKKIAIKPRCRSDFGLRQFYSVFPL